MAVDTTSAPSAGAAPAFVPSADTVSPQAALASIKMSEKILAQHRVEPLQSIANKIKAANLQEIAAEIVALLTIVTSEKDRALLQNTANVLGDADRLITSVVEANAKFAGA